MSDILKAEYQGEQVELNKPRRTPKGDSKKFEVFVMDGDKVKRVAFGDPDMEIRRDDDEARASFRARHNCDSQKDKTSAAYWSCLLWSDRPVSEILDKGQEDFLKGFDGKFHYLYKTTNLNNGKYYIGIHSTDNLDDGYLGSGVAFKKALNSLGKNCFTKEILEFFDNRDDLLAAEVLAVDEDVVKSENTYNLALGGMSYVDSLKGLSEEDFIEHQSTAGRLGGKASYLSKSEDERLEWHRKGRAASSGTKGKTLNIKDLESYRHVRKKSALSRTRYFCPNCNMKNLDGGNLKQHLDKVHGKVDTFEQVKKDCRMWEKDTTVSEATKSDGPKVGDKVSWNSSGGRASGIIRQIVRDGDVPDIPVKVTGTKDEPAARIEITDDEGKPTGEMVGHKLSTVSKETQEESTFKVLKIDQEQRIIFGWASVTKVDGELVVDRQGDVIKTETLHKAINDFMKGVRVGKVMHTGERVGDIIHSFPVSKDIMDALGIQTNKEGWIVGYYVEDETTWELVKSGEYTEFSIGGRGHKEEFSGN